MEFLFLLIPPAFILWFMFVTFMIAWLGGWRTLARYYKANKPVLDACWRFQSAKIWWCDYNNSLTIGVNAEGLYLVPFIFFRCGHAPLFIPWNELSVEKKQWFLSFSRLVLTPQQTPHLRICLHTQLGEKIATVVPNLWQLPADDEIDIITK